VEFKTEINSLVVSDQGFELLAAYMTKYTTILFLLFYLLKPLCVEVAITVEEIVIVRLNSSVVHLIVKNKVKRIKNSFTKVR
jgi:hypothetical protein